jgi:hypothetical protein
MRLCTDLKGSGRVTQHRKKGVRKKGGKEFDPGNVRWNNPFRTILSPQEGSENVSTEAIFRAAESGKWKSKRVRGRRQRGVIREQNLVLPFLRGVDNTCYCGACGNPRKWNPRWSGDGVFAICLHCGRLKACSVERLEDAELRSDTYQFKALSLY